MSVDPDSDLTPGLRRCSTCGVSRSNADVGTEEASGCDSNVGAADPTCTDQATPANLAADPTTGKTDAAADTNSDPVAAKANLARDAYADVSGDCTDTDSAFGERGKTDLTADADVVIVTAYCRATHNGISFLGHPYYATSIVAHRSGVQRRR